MLRFALALAIPSLLIACGGNDASLTGGTTDTTAPPPQAGNSTPPPAAASVTLGNLSRSTDIRGNTRILGEASSRAPTTVTFVQVTCAFKDAAGTTLGSDQTFIVGKTVRLTSTGAFTNTALDAGDVGYFEVMTSRADTSVASYSCEPAFTTLPTTPPSALMAIQNRPTVTSDFQGNVLITGSVKNIGTTPLVFGEVFAISTDRSGVLLDISSSLISGQQTTLPAGTRTNTALDVGGIGNFSITTTIPFSSPTDARFLFNWNDTAALAAMLSDGEHAEIDASRLTKEESHAQRNKKIVELRSRL